MIDQIQRTSTLPLPEHQTVAGDHDPLPLASSHLTETKAEERSSRDKGEAGRAAQSDAFAAYLDQTSITVVEDLARKRQPDAAELLTQGSVYAAPGVPFAG